VGTGITDGDKWDEDDSGRDLMPRKQAEYLELLLDGKFKTDAERCAELQITQRQGRRWRANPRFRAEWERRANERMVSADRLHQVVDVLFNAATNNQDVTAAKEYLRYVERFLPAKRIIQTDRELEHLSDDELEAEIQALMAQESDDYELEASETPLEAPESASTGF
jgi:hypothetical protein